MAKKSRLPAGQALVADRCRILLERLWDGSQSQMARDTGLTRATISNIVNGYRAPGREVLTKIGRDPRVNSEWLIFGIGQSVETRRAVLALADRLLPGTPKAYPDMIVGHADAKAEGDFATQYLWRIQPEDPILDVAGLHLMPNDLVQFESNCRAWRRKLRSLDKQLVAGRVRSSAGVRILLVRLHHDRKDGKDVLFAEVFKGVATESTVAKAPDVTARTEYGKPPRGIQIGDSPEPNEPIELDVQLTKGAQKGREERVEIVPKDIVAVVLRIIRPGWDSALKTKPVSERRG